MLCMHASSRLPLPRVGAVDWVQAAQQARGMLRLDAPPQYSLGQEHKMTTTMHCSQKPED